METYIELTVDGTQCKMPKGITVGEIFKILGIPYLGQLAATVVKDKERKVEATTNYMLKTNKGEILVKIGKENLEKWKDFALSSKGLKVCWITPKVTALGSFETDLKPSKEPLSYEKWDVGLSLAGYNPANTHLLFIKAKHEAHYIPPTEVKILGKVVAGRYVVNSLTLNDYLEEVKPIIEKEEYSKLIRRVDSLDWKICEPVEIYTHLKVKAYEKAKKSLEYLFSFTQDETVKVSDAAAAYLSCEKFAGIKVLKENCGMRIRGTVTIRNDGEKAGTMFFYRYSRPPVNSHNVIGFVENGVELLDASEKNDKLMIKIIPKRANVIGLTQKNAEEELLKLSLKQERCLATYDDAVVTEQEPILTFEAYEKGVVKTFGINSEKILKIKIFSEAPKTSEFLRERTGLIFSKIGRLKVYFVMPDLDFILFSAEPYPFQVFDEKLINILNPENTPKDFVDAFEIGVTNSMKKHLGLIGIRLKQSNSFGPTGEDFSGTNLVSKAVGGFKALENLKEGDILYVMEVS